MRVLSLFSGGGLGDFGLELAGMEIVGQVEIDEYCQKILKLRWPDVPKWRDVKSVTGKEVIERVGTVDLVSGGFPCQPFSVAGKRRGKQDDRYLWPEMLRVISEVKPAYVFGENVTGIIKSALDQVLSDLESIGYACQAFTVPACAFDAPHRRDRLWIVAYAPSVGLCSRKRDERKHENNILEVREPQKDKQQRSVWEHRTCPLGQDVANAKLDTTGTAQRKGTLTGTNDEQNNRNEIRDDSGNSGETFGRLWEPEPNVGRVAHGVANRVDRLKCLGNGQVVQVVEWIGKKIMEFDS